MLLAEVEIGPSAQGSRLRLRARAGARKNVIDGGHGGALKVSVTTAPERGRANEALERLLAEALRVSASAVRIVSGHTSRDKVVEIDGLAPEEVRRRLEGATAR